MPVMITKNLYTELGITNGATGTIRSVHFNDGEALIEEPLAGLIQLDKQPLYIIVELDDINMKPLEGLPSNHVPIYPQTVNIKVSTQKEPFNRRQFPLVPRFSCTAHKSQGQTMQKAIVDLEPPKHLKNIGVEFSYVPLSRVRRLRDLTLLRQVQAPILRARISENVSSMMEDFRSRDLCKDL